MSSEEERLCASLPPGTCENLVEEAAVGVCIVQDQRIVYANRRMREFSGHLASGDYPLEALAVFHPEDRAQIARQLQQRLAGQEAFSVYTVRLVDRTGGVSEVECHDRGVDFRGRPAIQLTLIDVTARIDVERNLHEYTARLEESNHFRELFGDILSHDLMNPVWIAENYLRLVMDAGVPDANRAFYQGMRGSLAKARGILADARTYLKIQDLVAFNREKVDLGQLAESVAQSLGAQCAEKGQQITVSAAAAAVILASPLIKEGLEQVLSNAIKYGAPDSEIVVSVSAGAQVRLAVSDRGPGVAEDIRERIFQRFESMEKGPIVGVGLGLAIVRRVVDLNGGKVWVEENPGGGSVFVLEFPAAA